MQSERYAIKFSFKLGKNATETYGMLQTTFGASCMNRASVFVWHKRFKEGRESVRDDERCGRCKEVNSLELIGQRVGLGLLCWGFKGVQEEIPSEEASILQIGSVAFPPRQCTSPQLHPFSQTIWARWASRQFLTFPIVQRLLPVTFDYSLSSETIALWDNWEDERGCDEGHWHALPWGLLEVVGAVQQVHCSRRRLLRREQEFHVCTINKSVHTKKVLKLI